MRNSNILLIFVLVILSVSGAEKTFAAPYIYCSTKDASAYVEKAVKESVFNVLKNSDISFDESSYFFKFDPDDIVQTSGNPLEFSYYDFEAGVTTTLGKKIILINTDPWSEDNTFRIIIEGLSSRLGGPHTCLVRRKCGPPATPSAVCDKTLQLIERDSQKKIGYVIVPATHLWPRKGKSKP